MQKTLLDAVGSYVMRSTTANVSSRFAGYLCDVC